MEYIALPIYVFLELLKWIIYIDVVLSWLTLLGIFIAIPFFVRILAPIYDVVKAILPVQFSGINFAPIILLFLIYAIQLTLIVFVPAMQVYISSISFL